MIFYSYPLTFRLDSAVLAIQINIFPDFVTISFILIKTVSSNFVLLGLILVNMFICTSNAGDGQMFRKVIVQNCFVSKDFYSKSFNSRTSNGNFFLYGSSLCRTVFIRKGHNYKLFIDLFILKKSELSRQEHGARRRFTIAIVRQLPADMIFGLIRLNLPDRHLKTSVPKSH